MRFVSELIDPRVLNILHASHVPLVTFSQILEQSPHDMNIAVAINFTAGFYDMERDLIAIHDNYLASHRHTEVLLHELIHWTGHPRRLGRETFRTAMSGVRPSAESHHTEEATAQLGMFKLAMLLGLDRPTHERALLDYMQKLDLANFDRAEYDSDRAVTYLLGLADLNSLQEAA